MVILVPVLIYIKNGLNANKTPAIVTPLCFHKVKTPHRFHPHVYAR